MLEPKSFDKQFKDFCDDWLFYAGQAREGDSESYQPFLEEVQKAFTKLYANSRMPEAVSLVEAVLKTATCELIGNSIKCKGSNTHSMAKKTVEMTDDELKKAWGMGKEWLIRNEEVTGTRETRNGISFDTKLFGAGLHRIESIEEEMKRRALT